LTKKFGNPDYTISNPTSLKVSKYKGLIVFEVDEWVDASGHATIWDGVNCSDKCYFTKSKKAYIWELKN